MFFKKIFLFNLYIIIILYYRKTNSSKIFNKNNNNNNNNNNNLIVYKKLGEIFKECFYDYSNPVIITEELSKYVNEYLCDRYNYLLPIIVINNNFKTPIKYQLYPKLPAVISTVNSDENTKVFISKLNSSPWWNVEAFFILVGTSEYSCKNASGILHTAWEKKLLSVIFLCYQRYENTVMVYSYNPFTHRAPYPWKKFDNNNKSSNGWTLYEQTYQKGTGMCSSLKYNKMEYLDGYKIKAVSLSNSVMKNTPKKYYSIESIKTQMGKYPGYIAENFLSILNVTPIIQYKTHGSLNNDGVTINIHDDVSNGLYDLLLSPKLLIYTSLNYSISYPYIYLPLVIITRKSRFLTTAEKIISFYDTEVVMATFGALFTLLAALMIYKRQPLISAFLEILRVLVSSSILQPLKNIPIRIHFFGVVWLILIINATFQGRLAAFLTQPDRRNVEDIKNLIDLKYKVYIYEHFTEAFVKLAALAKEENVVIQKSPDCFDQVVNNSHTACITFGLNAVQATLKHDLHMSRPIYHVYLNYIGNRDFPLIKKIDFILSRFMELGILDYCHERYYVKFVKKLQDKEAQETALKKRPIQLVDLSFAFVFIFVGISSSFIVFVFEIISIKKIKYSKNKL